MNKELAANIRESKQQPLIAIIGATVPTEGYGRGIGVEVGHLLRKHIEPRKGTLFTGGVDGVGVDAYIGVMKYCVDSLKSSPEKKISDDRFFVLVPEFDYVPVSRDLFEGGGYRIVPFEVPKAYRTLGAFSARGELDVVIAGKDMEERRDYLARVADVVIVVNGGSGTLDEAVTALLNDKPVIALACSGGTASILSAMKDSPYATTDMPQEIPSADHIKRINTSLIYVAPNTSEILRRLDALHF
jgi:SLOG cluster4 family